MKTKKKALITVLAALMLVVTSVMGTLAYLTSTDEVVNTFTVGNVKITMDEAKVTKEGEVVEDAERVETNTYHLLPGHEYTKDPTVHVDENSEEAYLFVKLTVEDNADMKAALEKHNLETDITKILTGFEADKWTATGTDADDGSREYFLTYNTTIKGSKRITEDNDTDTTKAEDITVFSKIVMPEELDNEDMATLKELKIVVTAYAVQADGFDTATEAWTATFGK